MQESLSLLLFIETVFVCVFTAFGATELGAESSLW